MSKLWKGQHNQLENMLCCGILVMQGCRRLWYHLLRLVQLTNAQLPSVSLNFKCSWRIKQGSVHQERNSPINVFTGLADCIWQFFLLRTTVKARMTVHEEWLWEMAWEGIYNLQPLCYDHLDTKKEEELQAGMHASLLMRPEAYWKWKWYKLEMLSNCSARLVPSSYAALDSHRAQSMLWRRSVHFIAGDTVAQRSFTDILQNPSANVAAGSFCVTLSQGTCRPAQCYAIHSW